MEPQINYSGIGGQPVYGKQKSGCGKFAIIGTIILLLVIAGGSYLIYSLIIKAKDIVKVPDLTNFGPTENPPNIDSRFTGSFIDAILVPQKEGDPKLWILSDASIKFYLRTRSPGRQTMGIACKDCKTITYIYEPASDKVLKQTTNTFNDLIGSSNIVYADGKIIQFTRATEKDEPRVNTYDINSGEITGDTKAFTDQHPEISSGIISITFHEKDNTVSVDTKDGQKNLVYDPVTDKIYENEVKMRKSLADNAGSSMGTLYTLRQEKGDERKSLFKITATKKEIIDQGSTLISYSTNTSFLKTLIPDATVEKISDKTYLSGEIYYSDDDCTVFIYLDQAGKFAGRIVTCIDSKSGKELWTMKRDQLFPDMGINDKDNRSYSSTQNRIKVRRQGNIITIAYKDTGIMAIDMQSGKKLWTVEVHAK